MRKLLIALNVLLVLAILGVAFFWHPEPDEMSLPGTQAARMAADVPPVAPAEQRANEIRNKPPTN